jgi:hypothetical protein
MAAKNELLYLVLQLLKEEGLTDAAHALEQSSGIYFDAKHFEELVIAPGSRQRSICWASRAGRQTAAR